MAFLITDPHNYDETRKLRQQLIDSIGIDKGHAAFEQILVLCKQPSICNYIYGVRCQNEESLEIFITHMGNFSGVHALAWYQYRYDKATYRLLYLHKLDLPKISVDRPQEAEKLTMDQILEVIAAEY